MYVTLHDVEEFNVELEAFMGKLSATLQDKEYH